MERASPERPSSSLAAGSSEQVNVETALALDDSLTFNGIGTGELIFSGPISGSGGLIQSGGGTISLTGANTYTGATVVNSGTISVGTGGSLADSEVEVNGGGTFNISGGSVNPGAAYYIEVGDSAGPGTATVNLSSGTLTSTETDIGNLAGPTAVFNQTGGTQTATSVYLGQQSGSIGTYNLSAGSLSTSILDLAYPDDSTGTFNLSGSGQVTAAAIGLGLDGTGIFNQTGGTVTINSTVYEDLVVGGYEDSSGTYNLSGGTLDVTGNNIYVGYGYQATGVFNQTGGTVTTAGFLNIGENGTGTYNLDAGLLATQDVTGGSGTSTFNFNGGTLQAAESNTTFLSGLTTANVQNGGALIDTNGYAITISQGLLSDASGGGLDGGLTVKDSAGGGVLTLNGANTYTGATTIDGGTLAIATGGSIADSSGVNLAASGTTFDISAGSQTIGSLSGVAGSTVNLGGSTLTVTEAPGDATAFAGVLNDNGDGGSLTLQGGGTLTLTGANTYSGPTIINASTLTIGAGGSLLNSHVEINGGSTLNIAGGSVNAGTAIYTEIGNVASGEDATLNLSSGTLTAAETDIGNVVGATGILNQTGGTNNATTSLVVAVTDDSTGIYNLSGGTATTDSLYLADRGNGTLNLSQTGSFSAISRIDVGISGTGVFNQTGGSVTTPVLYLGLYAGSTGTYNLSAGQLNATGFSLVVGYEGAGVFNQTGGTVTAAEPMYLGYGQGSTGTYNMDGGTLTVPFITSASGSSTFNFDGGTLEASENSVVLLSGLTAANVQNGGAIINTNGYSVIVIGQALLSDPTGGQTTDGGLTKDGTGTLTLAVANTYNGATTINEGAISVTVDDQLGAAGGTVNLNNNGELIFTGNITTARTFNLNNNSDILTPTPGGNITYTSGAAVNGGNLAGDQIFENGSELNGVTALIDSALSQSGSVNFDNTTINGSFTQAGSSAVLTATNGLTLGASGTMTVNGTVNLQSGGEFNGVTTINSGGTVNNSGYNVTLGAGSRTTINSGGTFNANSPRSSTPTTIEVDGLLTNNGSITGTVDANYGGMVKGSGSFDAVNVNTGGTFSPGNSPGMPTVTSLAFNGGSSYAFDIENATGTPGLGYDSILDTGALTLSAGATPNSQIQLALTSLMSDDVDGPANNFNPSQTYQFVLVQADGGITGFNASDFDINTTDFQNSLDGGTFTIVVNGDDLDLDFNPAQVPEPLSWTMLLGGLALLGILKFRCRLSSEKA